MPLEIPNTAREVENRSLTDVQRTLQGSNPQLKNSWLLALVSSNSNRNFDFYAQLLEAIKQNFPDTATGEFLERHAAIFGKQRLAATQATGNCVATGTASSIIPLATALTISGNTYTTTSSATITAQAISVLSIERSGQTATVTTVSDHNLANNVLVTMSGAGEAEYNVTDVAIIVTGLNTFEYQVVGSPATPATGTILASFDSASIPIQSDDFGSDQNIDVGAQLKLQSPLSGVDDTLLVDFGDVGGGTDQEIDESLRARMLDRIQSPVAHFNEADIIDQAKEVPGVTRVFVEGAGTDIGTVGVTSITRSGTIATVTLSGAQDLSTGQRVTITGANETEYNVTKVPILFQSSTVFHYTVLGGPATPATGTILSSVSIAAGTVRVYFMRDGDDDPIPSASEVQTVKDKIIEITPATTDVDADLEVLAPTPVETDYTFTALSPDTPTMRSSIIANLQQFYAENTVVSVGIDQDAYRSAIFNTVDTETGDIVQSFELSEPIGDIAIVSGQIGTLGTVVFP